MTLPGFHMGFINRIGTHKSWLRVCFFDVATNRNRFINHCAIIKLKRRHHASRINLQKFLCEVFSLDDIEFDFLAIDPAVLQRNFEINTMALLRLAQMAAPAMIDAGQGAILCTGNTSTYRGKAHFAGFAPTKAAQRILAESMARSLGPRGVHVAYVAIDAVIDLPWTRKAQPDQPDSYFCKPDDIAAECWHIVHQPRSAWTFDVMIRPDGENW